MVASWAGRRGRRLFNENRVSVCEMKKVLAIVTQPRDCTKPYGTVHSERVGESNFRYCLFYLDPKTETKRLTSGHVISHSKLFSDSLFHLEQKTNLLKVKALGDLAH